MADGMQYASTRKNGFRPMEKTDNVLDKKEFLIICDFVSVNQLRLIDNFNQFWNEVELSYQKAKSYSDFNSFLMSQIVNRVWGYDTLFVRLTDISSVFEDGFRYLISNFNVYSDALRKAEGMFLRHGIDTGVSSSSYLNAPVWVHCKCGSKAPVKIYNRQAFGGG